MREESKEALLVFLPFWDFLQAIFDIFSRPFSRSLAPTICP